MRIYEHSYRKKQGEIHEEAQDCLQFLGLFM